MTQGQPITNESVQSGSEVLCEQPLLPTPIDILDHFIRWLTVPLPEVTRKEIGAYIDHLLRKRGTPKTIKCHLQTTRLFFDYLMNEEGRSMVNPVSRVLLRLPKPLLRHLKDDQVTRLFAVIRDLRDRAMFMLMLRCGLRVQEVAHLTVDALEYQSSELFRKVTSLIKGIPVNPPLVEDRRLSMQLENDSRVVSLPGPETTVRGFSNADLIIEDEAAGSLMISTRPSARCWL